MRVVREYIPGTQARRDRLFQEILAKELGDCDGFALVEWEDGSETLKPVVWESDLSAIVDPETNDMWFARGRGAKPNDFNGFSIWHVYAGNAGIISTEACLIADAERWGDVVDVGDGEEVPDDLFELGVQDPHGGRIHGQDEVDGSVSMDDPLSTQSGQPQVQTDGGTIDVSDDAAIYDLRPPENYDGVAIDIRNPDDFDPYPVTREDAKAAAEWFERSVDDGTESWMKGFIVGIVVSVVLAAIFLGGPWLLGQLAGGGSGGGGDTVRGALPLFALVGPAARSFCATLAEEARAVVGGGDA